MGFFDLFKKKKEKKGMSVVDYLNGYYPSYSQFGENIYASDSVQNCIYSIVTELSKLNPTHIRKINGDDIPIDGNIQHILENPNPLMTTSDFIEKFTWLLLLNYNAFIYPLWEGNTLIGLYPLKPSFVDFLQDPAGAIHVKLKFSNGYEVTIPYADIIHIRHKYSVSEFMGGDLTGQPDHKALLKTLKMNDALLEGLAKALNMQTKINGLIKMKTQNNMEAQIEKIREFEKILRSNEDGFGTIDMLNEYIPLNRQVQLLDPTTLEFIDKKITRSFGCSVAIIDGDYTKAQYEAFYQKAIEPIVKKINQAFTKGIFTKRENQGYKNMIVFYGAETMFMTMTEKLTAIDLLVDTASAYKNEIRYILGMRPKAEFNGQLAVSSNKTNAENNKKDNKTTNEEVVDDTQDEEVEDNE